MFKNIIDVKNVYKEIDKKKIIQNLNLSIKTGNIFVLLGPNGSGKSTTIKLLNGILLPDKGEIKIFNESKINEKLRERIGIVSDTALLYNHMTAEENLLFFGEIYGMSRNLIKTRMATLLKKLQMDKYKDQKLGTYSTGMKKRLQLVKAVIHNPDLIFLDEPTSGLDPESTEEVNDFINKLSIEENKTIFLCSHHLEEVEVIGNDFGFMYNGNLFSQGSLSDLRKDLTENIIFKISNTDMLPQSLINESKQIEGNYITFHIDNEYKLSNIIKTLVDNNIDILHISTKKTKLKEMYFSLLEESKHEMEKNKYNN